MKSLIAPTLCGLSLLLFVPAHADATKDCQVGAYRLADGRRSTSRRRWRDAALARASPARPASFIRNKDGSWTSTYGWTDRPDGKTVSFSDCARGEIGFGDGMASASRSM